VLPGIWRLRVPLPWPTIPHGNAWALAWGDGIVLVDAGLHAPGMLAELERALDQVGFALADVRLVVCTHAHPDHLGEAARVAARAGCELWLHPDHAHGTEAVHDPEAAGERRRAQALAAGVPPEVAESWARAARRSGIAGPVRPDRDLVPGVTVASDAGAWRVHHTPGHAPSHVCLHLPERRLLLTGDHLLGAIGLYFDVGWSPDPVGEFLASLALVERLDARLGLGGHGRPFVEIPAHVEANRTVVAERLEAVRTLLTGPATVWELASRVYGERFTEALAPWLTAKTAAWLTHLAARGEVERREGTPERWAPA